MLNSQRSHRWRRWIVVGILLLLAVPIIFVAEACVLIIRDPGYAASQPIEPSPASSHTFMVVNAKDGKPIAGVPICFCPHGSRSILDRVAGWLNTERKSTGSDGKVTFTAPQGITRFHVWVEPRNAPLVVPKVGFQMPPGVSQVFLLARD